MATPTDTPARQRMCTLCRTRFAPRGGRVWAGCGAASAAVLGAVLLDTVVRPGPRLALALGAALVVLVACVLRLWSWARRRACTTCGSLATVPLLTITGVDLSYETAHPAGRVQPRGQG